MEQAGAVPEPKWQAGSRGASRRTPPLALSGGFSGIGAVPDFFFRLNTHNLKIIKRQFDNHHPETGIIDVKATPGPIR